MPILKPMRLFQNRLREGDSPILLRGDIGQDNGDVVSPTYKAPFAFTGTIHKVTFDLK